MLPILIAGGSGTRLWPLSTPHIPKPFVSLHGGSLFDESLERFKKWGAPPLTLATESLEPLLRKHYQRAGLSPEGRMLLEPTGRNTGPALAFLLRFLELQGLDEEIIGVFPADHLIKDLPAYQSTLKAAEEAAASGALVLLGIPPAHPATGYGYIEVDQKGSLSAQPVVSFREKPDAKTAEEFLSSQRFYWNSGQFIFRGQTLRGLFEDHAPELLAPFEDLKKDLSNLKEIYEQLPKVSFDYAVVEKTKDALVIPCEAGWSDLGSWEDLAEHLKSSEFSAVQAEENFVFLEDAKPAALIGVKNLIVADTKEGLLVMEKGRGQSVKDLPPPTHPQREVRPWGFFEVLSDHPELKTKIIEVLPGARLSYQSHQRRDELWVVLEGRGLVTLEGKDIEVGPGQSLKILRGQKHRMANTTDQPLRFFELQTGDYFGEDDIERFEDLYGRGPAPAST